VLRLMVNIDDPADMLSNIVNTFLNP